MNIDFLREHVKTLEEFAEETRSRLTQDPDNFWLRMTAKNQTQAAVDAAQDLKLAYANEVGELLDLRFMGPQANGSILLDSFLKIADPLSKAWKAAAFRIRHGIPQARVSKDIAGLLDLKLAGVSPGSTRIFVTGNAALDLTGESLLQSTLVQTFNLLSATNEEFYDAVDAVGGRAAHYFGDAMKAIHSAGLSAEFSWQSPNGMQTWHGSSDEITRIRTLLAAVAAPVTFEEEITGSVSGITDTGRLELRTIEGRVLVRFPLELTGKIQSLSIKKSATLQVSTTKYWDAVAKRDVYRRLLIDMPDTSN